MSADDLRGCVAEGGRQGEGGGEWKKRKKKKIECNKYEIIKGECEMG